MLYKKEVKPLILLRRWRKFLTPLNQRLISGLNQERKDKYGYDAYLIIDNLTEEVVSCFDSDAAFAQASRERGLLRFFEILELRANRLDGRYKVKTEIGPKGKKQYYAMVENNVIKRATSLQNAIIVLRKHRIKEVEGMGITGY